MPEYILPGKDLPEFKALDEFTQGYIEAMFFTEASSADDGELEGKGFADLSAESLNRIIGYCTLFQKENSEDLAEALDNGSIIGYDLAAAGRDFWYTSNGHGVGFWDRDLGDVGDRLSDTCRGYRSRHIYMADNGKVCIE